MNWLALEVNGVLSVGFAARLGGFGETMDSKSWRTVVSWNPPSGDVGRCTPQASVRSTLPVSAE